MVTTLIRQKLVKIAKGPRGRVAAVAVIAIAALTTAAGQQPAGPFDVLIVNGRIIDGAGNPWFSGDVGIRAGRIAAVGRLGPATATRTIDARGLIVAPAFFDMHTHSDHSLLAGGTADSMVRQGVSFNILGEGGSPGPLKGLTLEGARRSLAAAGLKLDWTTLGEYFDRLERQGVSLNVASYVGAGGVRHSVIGDELRDPTPAELGEMRAMVQQAMEDGAFGLCSSLSDALVFVQKTPEVIELARVAARYGGIYATHLRDLGDGVVDAVREAIHIGRTAGLPVHIFHLGANSRTSWGKMKEAVAIIDEARANGLDVTVDDYPYTWGSHGLGTLLPPWAHDGGPAKLVERLKDPANRRRLRQEIEQGIPGWFNRIKGFGFEGIMVANVPVNGEKYEMKTLTQIAKEAGKDPHEALFDLLIEQGGRGGTFNNSKQERDKLTVLQAPWMSVGSDGSAISPAWKERAHPRSFGSFARVLGWYVREQGVLTLEEAIRKMTSLAAQTIGLRDRGLLREGFWADVVVFDAGRVIDKATRFEPNEYPEGVEHVLVNGVPVVLSGAHTGAKPGKVLRGPGYRPRTSSSGGK
ncbi:MAG: D-aminoacylase [Acidobacteria bacterium]|nr:D-aminoacylase [Acidobacteriota bacterium]